MASHSVLPSSTANWHWKNKNVSKWAKGWFEEQLVTVTADSVRVVKVTEVDGDVELGQRKSKLITIFDCKVVFNWTGATPDGTEVKGTCTIPEVSHEVLVDKSSDLEYMWNLETASSKEVDEVYRFVKAKLPAALETKLKEFPSVMLDTHARDIVVAGSNDPSRSSTPTIPSATSGSSSPAPSVAQAPASKKPEPKAVNTKKVVVEGSFQASADDLFSILTDEKRIPHWSRAPAQSKPEVGSEYSLFGGGVKGKYVSIKPAKEVVQSWALSSPTWPSGHVATLTTTFDQGSDSTKLVLSLDGVPTGMEDETKRNLEGYYIGGLKSIGLGSVL